MDTELLRTFLEVNSTRHFAKAAGNLYVTQAAVSARIRQLEETIGTRLFTRHRNNIQLTTAGHRLLSHAEAILNTWNRALLETGASNESGALVALGCLPSIWETYLTDWLADIYDADPTALLQIELLNSDSLIRRLRENSLTIGLLYEPPTTGDLIADPVTQVTLVMVCSRADQSVDAPLPHYIYVDWGTSFAVMHNNVWKIATAPALRIDSPRVAYQFILERGGTAFLPTVMVADAIAAGRLHPVADAPQFERTAFMVRAANTPLGSATSGIIDSLVKSV